MKKVTNLTWPAKLALLNEYKPSITTACNILGITSDELKTAQDLEQRGTLKADDEFDVHAYASLFSSEGVQNPKTKNTLESIVRESGKGQPALSATRKTTTPKKRGRKGNNIALAFANIPSEPTSVADFATSYGVSVAVLRQSKRFDRVGTGNVRVKKDKASASLMIWREDGNT